MNKIGCPLPRRRLRTIDWLRGLSVLVMMVAHSLTFLSPAHDADRARDYFNDIDGLPGPIFILTAGFSLAYVTAREGDAPERRRPRAVKSLKRIGQVFLGSLVLRLAMWDTLRHPVRLLWIDVLTCIAMMLLGLWLILFALPRAARVATIVLLAVSCFIVAPWVEAPRSFGWVTPFLNNGWHLDTWPLVPWAGYGFMGALIGMAAGRSTRPLRAMSYGFAGIIAIGLMMFWFGPMLTRLDASVSPWMITNAGQRLWRIGCVGGLFLVLESLGLLLERGPGKLIGLFSRQSLVAFVAHLIVLFGYWRFRPLNPFIRKVDWGAYVVLAGIVILATAGVCWLAERWQTRGNRVGQSIIASRT